MIFGNVILGYDQMSVPSSTSHIDNITSTTLSNAYMDDFYLTEDTDSALGNNVPENWDENTILDAKFEDSTGLTAGNINVSIEELSGGNYVIKRRVADSNKWITMYVYPFVNPNSGNNTRGANEDTPTSNTFTDYTCAAGVEYEYAIVFVKGDKPEEREEGDYYTVKITPDTDRLIICTGDELWGTILTDGFCDNQRNTAPGVINTLNDKYPTIVDNSVANYETVNVSAEFYPIDENGCLEIPDNPEDRRAALKDIKKFKDFLMNRKAKILKNIDGRMWFCYVTTPPSDNAKDVYYFREISFGVTEVADVEDQEELYNSGFITATEDWWNT